jgi:hypothetical protein
MMLGLPTESAFEAFSTSKLARKSPFFGKFQLNIKIFLKFLHSEGFKRCVALNCSFATFAPKTKPGWSYCSARFSALATVLVVKGKQTEITLLHLVAKVFCA